MLQIWSSDAAAPQIQGRKVMLIVSVCVICLTSADGQTVSQRKIHSLTFNQGETDTRVVLYSVYAQQQDYNQVVIRSSDSDISHKLLHNAHQLGIENGWRL